MFEPNVPGRPLPTPARDEKLPSLPPIDPHSDYKVSPHLPPEYGEVQRPNVPAISTGLSMPAESVSPTEQKIKKLNPLIDLIESEKLYVDQLTGIIRKIASAWSRSNLPPPELDSMFRSIEAVYKSNRNLLLKLKEIGTNPSSPKDLGDLLMRWIDDLEGPYTSYCQKYCSGFDDWDPVVSNPKLVPIIEAFAVENPPPANSESSGWTLDELFLLPKARMKYYKKLYNRLLKSTTPGRSDHRLLLGALDKLDRLLAIFEDRQRLKVGASNEPIGDETMEDEVVLDMRGQQGGSTLEGSGMSESSRTSSARDSGPSAERSSQTPSTSISRGSTSTLSMPISDLERRLATDRTLDIFTMQPKVVKLQISPPTLTFTREVRMSLDVVITVTPKSTGVEIVHRRGHIFLLTDLFLVCEQISPEDRAQFGPDGPDMWLCYPPLAGKVLRVSEVEGQNNALQVAVMKKEYLVLHTDSSDVLSRLITEFKDCIETASSLPPISKQQPPPIPPLPEASRQDFASASVHRSNSAQSTGTYNGTVNPPDQRPFHPIGPHSAHNQLAEPMSNLALSSEARFQQGASRVPHIHEPAPDYPSHRMSDPAQPYSNAPLVAPPRGNSLTQSSQDHPGYGAGYPVNGRLQGNRLYTEPPSPVQYPAPYGHITGRVPPGLRKSESSRSLHEPHTQTSLPTVPSFPGGPPQPSFYGQRTNHSYGSLPAPVLRTLLPSAQIRAVSVADTGASRDSPPASPIEETAPKGPVTSKVTAQMKCKVFLKQHHQQWKSLGSAKLKLYHQSPTNMKQLVVEAESGKSVLISTIVLNDGVERVGKTGVAIELSDNGARTGIVYMIQLRNETSAGGLFDSLLAGSDRSTK